MLQHNDRRANLLGYHARRAIGGEVTIIARSVDLAGREEDDRRARTLPVGRIVVVELLEGAEGRVGVVDKLGEGGVAGGGDGLPVAAGHVIPAMAAAVPVESMMGLGENGAGAGEGDDRRPPHRR